MYKCSSPKIVFDMYEVLPAYGENEIKIIYLNNKLILDIFYEDKDTGQVKNLKLEFDSPVFHRFESFPGVDGMNTAYEKYEDLGSLVEYSSSEYRDSWEKHFDNAFQFFHYELFFLSENKRLEVVSKRFIKR